MERVSRRSVMRTAGAAAVSTVVVGRSVAADEPKAPKLWPLEGELKIHPKFVYHYYLVLGEGQTCGLYGSDHSREPDLLARLQPPVRVRVHGTLGTEHHAGGTKDNPSTFPEMWWLYMDVHEVEQLK